MLDKDISELMGIVPNDFAEPVIRGGAFDDVKDVNSPFGFQKCEGMIWTSYPKVENYLKPFRNKVLWFYFCPKAFLIDWKITFYSS